MTNPVNPILSERASRSDHCPAMKGIKTAQRRQARGTRREEGGNQRRTPCHPAPDCCASCLTPRTSLASCLTPRAPFASHPSCRAPLTPRRHPLYGRSVAAPYVAARRSPHMPLASSPRAARLAPLPRAHRLIGATPFQTAGAGHLRRGYACDDGRRRAGAESGHPGAAMTNCLARIRILRGDTPEPRVLR